MPTRCRLTISSESFWGEPENRKNPNARLSWRGASRASSGLTSQPRFVCFCRSDTPEEQNLWCCDLPCREALTAWRATPIRRVSHAKIVEHMSTPLSAGRFRSRERELRAGARLPRFALWLGLLAVSSPPGPFAQTRQHASRPPDVHLRRGTALLNKQDWKNAAAEFKESLRLDPQSAAAYIGLGAAEAKLGDRARAAAALHRSIEIDPRSPKAHYSLGLFLADENLAAAVPEFQTALSLEPDYPEARLALALAWQGLGETQKSVAEYRAVLRRRPYSADAHNGLGLVYNQTDQFPEAVAEFRKAVALKPDFIRAYNNLGSALAKAGQVDEAARVLRQAAKLEPRNVQAHITLGLTLRGQGKPQSALAEFKAAL